MSHRFIRFEVPSHLEDLMYDHLADYLKELKDEGLIIHYQIQKDADILNVEGQIISSGKSQNNNQIFTVQMVADVGVLVGVEENYQREPNFNFI